MTFEPQIPDWGNEYKNYLERLKSYHDWLCKTGINNGLISEKPMQYIWDEFIVHSLYFGKILQNIKNNDKNIYDLGTGGGIPGIPIALTNPNKLFTLVDISESRVFELQRLKNILNLENVEVLNESADAVLTDNNTYISRCFISSKDVLKNIKQLKNVTYIVSSNGENLNENKEKFHVKQEKFTINSTNIRHIDVINVK